MTNFHLPPLLRPVERPGGSYGTTPNARLPVPPRPFRRPDPRGLSVFYGEWPPHAPKQHRPPVRGLECTERPGHHPREVALEQPRATRLPSIPVPPTMRTVSELTSDSRGLPGLCPRQRPQAREDEAGHVQQVAGSGMPDVTQARVSRVPEVAYSLSVSSP